MLSGLSLEAFGPDSFWALTRGLGMLLTGVAIAATFGLLLGRTLPKGWVWDRLVLGTSGKPVKAASPRPIIGGQGVVLTRLVPTGVVDVGGVHYEGRLEVGMAEKGSLVRVIRVESLTTIIVEVI
jgi:membrane-bound serine protease (ClpP class)